MNSSSIWNINDWRANMTEHLRSSAIQTDIESNFEKTIIVSYSAASQALLRSLVDLYSEKQIKLSNIVDGLLMIAPGVGMDLNNYMERLMPGSLKRLEAGDVLEHPTSVDTKTPIPVNLRCLEEYVNVSFEICSISAK